MHFNEPKSAAPLPDGILARISTIDADVPSSLAGMLSLPAAVREVHRHLLVRLNRWPDRLGTDVVVLDIREPKSAAPLHDDILACVTTIDADVGTCPVVTGGDAESPLQRSVQSTATS